MPCYFVYDAFKLLFVINLQLEIVVTTNIKLYCIVSVRRGQFSNVLCWEILSKRNAFFLTRTLHFHGVSDVEARVGGVDQLVPFDQFLHLLLS